MSEKPLFAKCDAARWNEVIREFRAARDQLPPSSWVPQANRPSDGMTHEEIKQDLRGEAVRLLKSYGADAGNSFCDWFASGKWPEMEPETHHLARAMAEGIFMFVSQIVIEPNGAEPGTIIPFPDMPVREVILWLIVEWWVDRGASLWIVTMAVVSSARFVGQSRS
jgi:hypothetical protein